MGHVQLHYGAAGRRYAQRGGRHTAARHGGQYALFRIEGEAVPISIVMERTGQPTRPITLAIRAWQRQGKPVTWQRIDEWAARRNGRR